MSNVPKDDASAEPLFGLDEVLIIPGLREPDHVRPRRRAPTPQEIQQANAALADAVDYVNVVTAERLRRCVPGYRCHLTRLCALCSQVRASEIVEKRQGLLRRLPGRSIHVTLTNRGRERLTRDSIQVVIDRVKEFRLLPVIRKDVAGGISNVQVKYSECNGGWLVHAHLLVDYRGDLTDDEIEREWAREWTQLGGGWSIDAKTITRGTEWRVLRYGASGQKLPYDPRLIRQFLRAVFDLTMICAWGTLHPNHGKPRVRRAPGTTA